MVAVEQRYRGQKAARSTVSMTSHLSPNDNGNEHQNAIRHQMDRFNAEYVERELQKRSVLQVSIVRDKICALKKRKATEQQTSYSV